MQLHPAHFFLHCPCLWSLLSSPRSPTIIHYPSIIDPQYYAISAHLFQCRCVVSSVSVTLPASPPALFAGSVALSSNLPFFTIAHVLFGPSSQSVQSLPFHHHSQRSELPFTTTITAATVTIPSPSLRAVTSSRSSPPQSPYLHHSA